MNVMDSTLDLSHWNNRQIMNSHWIITKHSNIEFAIKELGGIFSGETQQSAFTERKV